MTDNLVLACLEGKNDWMKEECKNILIREAIKGELDAINLYESIASTTGGIIGGVVSNIAKEEKTHVGELMHLLIRFDTEQKKELKEGAKEVDGKTPKFDSKSFHDEEEQWEALKEKERYRSLDW